MNTSYPYSYPITSSPFIYLNGQRFEEAYKGSMEHSEHLILDLGHCGTEDDFYRAIEKGYEFPAGSGQNLNAVGDSLMGYAYDGKSAFFEVRNWQEFASLHHDFFYDFLEVLIHSVFEAKRLKSIDYHIFIDGQPDFEGTVLESYKKFILR
jgi:RNAse (barnase) inhibitor barstar